MRKKKRTVTIQEGAKKTKLSAIEDLSYTTDLAGSMMLDIDYPFAVEAMLRENRAIARSKFHSLVYTTDGGRRSGNACTNPRIGHRAA